jgi:hypothetical protein
MADKARKYTGAPNMAWQQRGGSRSYYYRTTYFKGQYFNTYYGGGRQGQAFEEMFDKLSREKRLARIRPSDPPDPPAGQPAD